VNFKVTQCSPFKGKTILRRLEMKKKGIIVLLICSIVAPLMLAGVAEARQTFYINLTRDVYPQLNGT
jgi:hypothetical protein